MKTFAFIVVNEISTKNKQTNKLKTTTTATTKTQKENTYRAGGEGVLIQNTEFNVAKNDAH